MANQSCCLESSFLLKQCLLLMSCHRVLLSSIYAHSVKYSEKRLISTQIDLIFTPLELHFTFDNEIPVFFKLSMEALLLLIKRKPPPPKKQGLLFPFSVLEQISMTKIITKQRDWCKLHNATWGLLQSFAYYMSMPKILEQRCLKSRYPIWFTTQYHQQLNGHP